MSTNAHCGWGYRQTWTFNPSFYVGARVQIPGLPQCAANHLPAETYPQPLHLFFSFLFLNFVVLLLLVLWVLELSFHICSFSRMLWQHLKGENTAIALITKSAPFPNHTILINTHISIPDMSLGKKHSHSTIPYPRVQCRSCHTEGSQTAAPEP